MPDYSDKQLTKSLKRYLFITALNIINYTIMATKLQISSMAKAIALSKEFLASNHMDVDFNEKGVLAEFYRSPVFSKKVGGVCFVFDYHSAALGANTHYKIHVKCMGIRRNIIVKLWEADKCSLREIEPHSDFEAVGEKFHYDGEKIIPLQMTPSVQP